MPSAGLNSKARFIIARLESDAYNLTITYREALLKPENEGKRERVYRTTVKYEARFVDGDEIYYLDGHRMSDLFGYEARAHVKAKMKLPTQGVDKYVDVLVNRYKTALNDVIKKAEVELMLGKPTVEALTKFSMQLSAVPRPKVTSAT